MSALHLFFAIHTYYATFIKLLAVQIAHYYLMPKVGTGLAQVASSDTERLRAYLRRMERGGVFAEFGIKNFLEGDFFGWYLDAWDEGVEQALRRIVGNLANYSLVTLDVDPEETRDLLKQLYQNLMPKRLRHDLGEYYTPDWLAERLLNQLGVDGNPARRLLDPACGSGTFLVLTIRRIRQYADEKMLPPADVLEQILQNVVGFDLNPLAVISARTNYLLALGDLLQHPGGEIHIPVYLADSILTPRQGTTLETYAGVEFPTTIGKFAVPRSLVDARSIDRLADLLEECVGADLTPEQFQARLLQTFPSPPPHPPSPIGRERERGAQGEVGEGLPAAEIRVALELYERLRDLNRQGINGIWARIIKNAFAPLFQGRFDYVAGNPPWVNWESLPDEYRQETASLCSRPPGAGQGFRRFWLGDGTPLAVLHVDDMADLKPFEGASNRTAIVILERGRPTTYPVPYTHWYKPGGGSVIAEDLTLEEITQKKVAAYRRFVAQPVDESDPTSPWITGHPRALKAVKKVLGVSDYQAKAGVCTWLNGVYWLEVIGQRPDGLVVVSNLTEGAKRKMESVQAAIEPDLLYPLLRGRDVSRWQATPSAYILVTHEPGMKLKAVPEDELAVRLPKTYAYLKHFEAELRNRSGYRRYFSESDPFYSMFDVGDYTFAPYKVVWPNIGSELACTVVSSSEGKPVVPQHVITLVALGNDEEAHFVCAVINSSPVNFALQS